MNPICATNSDCIQKLGSDPCKTNITCTLSTSICAFDWLDKDKDGFVSKEEFTAYFTPKNPNKPEIHGGFALTHWNGSPEVEAKIKEELKVTIRCIPDVGKSDFDAVPGSCPFTGEPSERRVIFGKAY